MKHLKKWIFPLVFVSAVLTVSACRDKDDSQKVIEDVSTVDTAYKVYYIKKDEYVIEGVTWEFQSETADELVGECLDLLSQAPEEKRYVQPIQGSVVVLDYAFDESSKQVNVFFNDAYASMDHYQEVLCRAAVVKTLTQFDTVVDYVQFFVNNQALRSSDGRYMVMMGSDFVDSTSADLKNLNESTLKLYFASTDGTQLAEEDVYVHYYNASPVERVVMESLRSGPLSDNLNRTFSQDTKINDTYISDNICYVDVSQRFLQDTEGSGYRVKIYSVVNSLCALPSVERVQILIDGQVSDYTQDGISISEPLAPDMDIVVKTSDTPPALEN